MRQNFLHWAIFVAVWASGGVAAGQDCGSMEYRNQNQVELRSIELSRIEGVVQDEQCCPIPGVCIGVFSETDRRLVASTASDENGLFRIGPVPGGDYRLVATYPEFCAANTGIQLAPDSRSRNKLLLNMRLQPYVSSFESPFGTLSGKVLFAASRERSACSPPVVLMFQSEEREVAVITDDDGGFSACLRPGKYTLSRVEGAGSRSIPLPKRSLAFVVKNNRSTRRDVLLASPAASPAEKP